MLRIIVLACLLGTLAGCAGRSPQTAAPPPSAPLQRGTILAIHTVPQRDPPLLRRVLRGLGGPQPATPVTEFIVQADDGSTLAVVQPSQPALHVGSRVTLQRGPQAQILGLMPART